MRFSIIAALVSALAVAATPLPGLSQDKAQEMKQGLAHMAAALDTNDCHVAKAQLSVLKHSFVDGIVEGHVEDEQELVKFITREEGDAILKKVQQIRDGGSVQARELVDNIPPPQKSQGPKGPEGGPTGKGGRKGSKGRKGKGRKGKGKGKGRKGKGRDSMNDDISASETELLNTAKLPCGSSRRILKVVRNFIAEVPKTGKTTDGKSVYYVHPTDERDLRRKIVKAATSRRT